MQATQTLPTVSMKCLERYERACGGTTPDVERFAISITVEANFLCLVDTRTALAQSVLSQAGVESYARS